MSTSLFNVNASFIDGCVEFLTTYEALLNAKGQMPSASSGMNTIYDIRAIGELICVCVSIVCNVGDVQYHKVSLDVVLGQGS